MSRTPLPIDDHLPAIQDTVRRARAAIIVAAPGAGKTTRVPPALIEDGPVLVLQPRRVAARAIAARIAQERGWTLGAEVGWHVRFERRFSARTRLLLATEGILTARLLHDPLLSDFTTLVLDEFHERSVHADLGIALARQAWIARDDLRLVVMSATIDARPVSAFLRDCPIIDVPGRTHPVRIDYAPGQAIADAARDVARHTAGSLLCFLPGAPEIQRATGEVMRALPEAEVLPLHGSLAAADQDRALQPPAASRRRVILATNIAETSLTVPGVTAVIDSGLHKVARYDGARGIDSLEVERISQDSADQRAGRAGRLAPGLARRLWSAHDRLRPQREPDVVRIDLAAPLLDLLAWGGDPETFEWFEAPPADALDAAWTLLRRLHAVRDRTITALGRTLRAWPLHPRLGRILLAARDGAATASAVETRADAQSRLRTGIALRVTDTPARASALRDAARVCALLAERHFLPPRHELTTCDLFAAMDAWNGVPPHIQQVARQLEAMAEQESSDRDDAREPGDRRASQPAGAESSEVDLRRAILTGYPDRVARRREPGSPRVLLASGHGAALSRDSGVHDGEFLIALDVQAASSPATAALGLGLTGAHARARGAATVASAGGGPSGSRPAAPSVIRARPGGAGLDVGEARIRIASLVSRDWLRPTRSEIEHWFDAETSGGRVRAARRDYYEAILLGEHPQAPDPEIASRLLADAWLARGPRDADQQLARRLAFAGLALDLPTLVARAAAVVAASAPSSSSSSPSSSSSRRAASAAPAASSAWSLDALDLPGQLTWDESQALARGAPETLRVPSGRSARLDYDEDGGVSAAVKLQELFGLADTPRVGPRQAPVLLRLLAPNGRPVQTTRDLRSFWDRTYPEVRKELRGRYPKHPWPDDPWSATPTARTTRRHKPPAP